MSKTYSKKSNATRAAKAFAKARNVDVASITVYKLLDGTWAFMVAPLAKPYRIVQGRPARVAARKAAIAAKAAEAAPLEAAAKAALAAKPATPAGDTPRHKEFALYGRSAILSPVAFVHKFLDANGKTLSRKDALFQLAQAGVNNHTARTQYQRWFAANK